ncbi:lipocalin family protein [Flagellimonas oceanensis]|uniref:lipocalin family protein n=1 Tax=Flagellimonas oceanensis TaxID=2499163 RepID=UPI000F8E2938|nr:lipocalin family protein [Allomuricauda oceanensis]
MKKNLFTLLLVAVLISSCSSDDGDGPVNASIVGTWDIVELNFGESVDWDGDGTSSDNLLDEIECFAGTVTFTAEGEYSSATTEINFEATETEFTITCGGPVTASGTYSVDGNKLTATDAEDGKTGESTFSISGDTVTFVGPVQIVDVEDVDGEATLVLVRR